MEVGTARRPTDAAVRSSLQATGVHDVRSVALWEVRKIHENRDALKHDLAQRDAMVLPDRRPPGLLMRRLKQGT